jgi:type IV pilus assembly protein PilN
MATGKNVNVQSLVQDAPALLIAAGLAMRAFESDGVNLLAWRDELRQRRQRSFVIGSALAASLAGVMVFAGVQVYDGQIGAQKQRNNFLSTEIARVEKQITEIESLRTLRGQLVDRMQVIQDLQGRRSGIVYVFDNLVTSLVDGSYYTSLNRTGDRIQLEGRAENNNRISNLMRSIEASAWFKDPNLTQVVAQKTGSLPNVFSLNVSLDDPNGPELADGGLVQ